MLAIQLILSKILKLVAVYPSQFSALWHDSWPKTALV
jgi:hypothetical protein